MSKRETYLHILQTTRPNDPTSVVSQPVGEACQWAAREIQRLQDALMRISQSDTLQGCKTLAEAALNGSIDEG